MPMRLRKCVKRLPAKMCAVQMGIFGVLAMVSLVHCWGWHVDVHDMVSIVCWVMGMRMKMRTCLKESNAQNITRISSGSSMASSTPPHSSAILPLLVAKMQCSRYQ